MPRRITVIASLLFAAGALTAGSMTAANAAATPLTPAESQGNLTPDAGPTCQAFTENYYNSGNGHGNGQYFYNSGASPHLLFADSTVGRYCTRLDGTNIIISESGTNECLSVESNHQVGQAACSLSSRSEVIHNIIVTMDGAYPVDEFQFVQDTADCIYQNGRNSPVDVKACNPNNTGDLWITDI
jgi:hypothetical protein